MLHVLRAVAGKIRWHKLLKVTVLGCLTPEKPGSRFPKIRIKAQVNRQRALRVVSCIDRDRLDFLCISVNICIIRTKPLHTVQFPYRIYGQRIHRLFNTR